MKKAILALVLIIVIPLLFITISKASEGLDTFLPIVMREREGNPPSRPTPTSQASPTPTPGRDTPTPNPTATEIPPTPTYTEIPPTATNTEIPPTATNTPVPPTPTEVPCDYVCITDINNNPDTPDDLETEFVVITNFTDEEVDMTDWLLCNSDGICYSFDMYFLGAGESVNVWTKEGMDTQTDLYWDLPWPAWDQFSDCGTLMDRYNQVVDEYCY